MNTAQAAKIMGISHNHVAKLVAEGVIEAEKLPWPSGYRYELLDSDVYALAERYRQDRNWRARGPISETSLLILAGESNEMIAEKTGVKVRSVQRARLRLLTA